MSALYFPAGVSAPDLLPRLAKRGIVVAGGLLAGYQAKYFRIGHMGVSVVDPRRTDVDAIVAALEGAMGEIRAEKAAQAQAQ